ncbi:MAG TPA: hypothetical protein VMH27_21835 [Puia sp.]|nr:hypothetical protein [Puia sp.]
MQKLKVRIVSFFLILIFSQKMGLELWLHNWLHETTVTASVSSAPKAKAGIQHQRVRCNCIDDALNPLVEADVVDFDAGPQPALLHIADIYSSRLSAEREFSSLRGPPSANRFL